MKFTKCGRDELKIEKKLIMKPKNKNEIYKQRRRTLLLLLPKNEIKPTKTNSKRLCFFFLLICETYFQLHYPIIRMDVKIQTNQLKWIIVDVRHNSIVILS